jgi:predicted transport protein
MADIKLFKITDGVKELPASTVSLEVDLQRLIEKSMFEFFGVRFLASEYITSHGGRIDSLGIDENNCPVIFEYKRTSTENVINQGLFYLDWLLDHKADFEILVMRNLGKECSDILDWSMPRLICIAGDFTKYDEYAVKQINRNISLIRYKKFGSELLLLELMNSNIAKPLIDTSIKPAAQKAGPDKTFEEILESTTQEIRDLYHSIRNYILTLDADITENQLKLYVAFKKIKNIVCAEVNMKQILLFLRLDPDTIELEKGFSLDMRGVGHFGTGDLKLIIRNSKDFEKAKPLIDKAFEDN